MAGALVAIVVLVAMLRADWPAEIAAAVAAGEPTEPSAAAGAAVVGLLAVCLILVDLPVALYSHGLERHYGLVQMSWGRWWRDDLPARALSAVAAAFAGGVVYGLMGQAGDHWWWMAGLLGALLSGVVTWLAPVWLSRVATVRPLADDALARRLLALASRAGAPALGVFEWPTGERTRRANAALAGLGATRRIIVSDTLLTDFSADEMAVIVAHELAHHAHRDVWRTLLLQTGTLLAGAYVVHGLMHALASPAGLAGPFDPTGAPLLVLLAGGWSVTTTPLAHAVSRTHERRADRFALDLTRDPASFASAMRRLGQQHLADDSPSPLVRLLWHAHPPMGERLAAARAWAHAHRGEQR